MSRELNGQACRIDRDCLVINGSAYTLEDVREGLELLKQARARATLPTPAEEETLFRVTVPVDHASGTQSWVVPAHSAEEARKKWEQGASDCQFEAEELEVTSLQKDWAEAEPVEL